MTCVFPTLRWRAAAARRVVHPVQLGRHWIQTDMVWSLSTGASTHLIGCSCHITQSADTYHLCDIRIRMPVAGVCRHFHVFVCILGDPFPWTTSSQQQKCSGQPCVLSLSSPRRQPAPARHIQMQRLSSHRPFLSPYSSDSVHREDRWGSDRLIYDMSKRHHWRLSIIIAVTAPWMCLWQWCHWWQRPWLTG